MSDVHSRPDRAFVFDVEGTIFDLDHARNDLGHAHLKSLWLRCAAALGDETLSADASLARAWDAGDDRSYIRWCRAAVGNLKRHGLTRSIFEEAIQGLQFYPGVAEAASLLIANGVEVILISGGIHALTLRAAREFGVDICYSGADFQFADDGALSGATFFPSDYEGKIHYLNSVLADLDIPLERVGFIGDGNNDVPIAKHVGFSLGFRPVDSLARVTNANTDNYCEAYGIFQGWLDRTHTND